MVHKFIEKWQVLNNLHKTINCFSASAPTLSSLICETWETHLKHLAYVLKTSQTRFEFPDETNSNMMCQKQIKQIEEVITLNHLESPQRTSHPVFDHDILFSGNAAFPSNQSALTRSVIRKWVFPTATSRMQTNLRGGRRLWKHVE